MLQQIKNSEQKPLDKKKFQNPDITAKGERRAFVEFEQLKTLWFMTGSLCNIECVNCYIDSSPKNDHFVYLTHADILPYLNEVEDLGFGKIEIGFTGGEPFMNPYFLQILRACLERGHNVLILTNAMRPIMRPQIQKGLLDLQKRFESKMTIRISLDHYNKDLHDMVRGTGSFDKAVLGIDWLSNNGFDIHLAGRTLWNEANAMSRKGYADLIKKHGWDIDPDDTKQLVLFPEMDANRDVPEITVDCWDILGRTPSEMMCANSRMVIKRKGEKTTKVLACTLLWDNKQFEMGQSLQESFKTVKLNHPHCASFCVLGGASCSA